MSKVTENNCYPMLSGFCCGISKIFIKFARSEEEAAAKRIITHFSRSLTQVRCPAKGSGLTCKRWGYVGLARKAWMGRAGNGMLQFEQLHLGREVFELSRKKKVPWHIRRTVRPSSLRFCFKAYTVLKEPSNNFLRVASKGFIRHDPSNVQWW